MGFGLEAANGDSNQKDKGRFNRVRSYRLIGPKSLVSADRNVVPSPGFT